MRIAKLSVLFLVLAGFWLPASTLHATQSRQVTKMVKPDYPVTAREMKVEGTVRLQAVVDRDGNVENVIVVSGHTLLKPAAVTCVKKWKYEPSGNVSLVPIEIVFRLDTLTQVSLSGSFPNLGGRLKASLLHGMARPN